MLLIKFKLPGFLLSEIVKQKIFRKRAGFLLAIDCETLDDLMPMTDLKNI